MQNFIEHSIIPDLTRCQQSNCTNQHLSGSPPITNPLSNCLLHKRLSFQTLVKLSSRSLCSVTLGQSYDWCVWWTGGRALQRTSRNCGESVLAAAELKVMTMIIFCELTHNTDDVNKNNSQLHQPLSLIVKTSKCWFCKLLMCGILRLWCVLTLERFLLIAYYAVGLCTTKTINYCTVNRLRYFISQSCDVM